MEVLIQITVTYHTFDRCQLNKMKHLYFSSSFTSSNISKVPSLIIWCPTSAWWTDIQRDCLLFNLTRLLIRSCFKFNSYIFASFLNLRRRVIIRKTWIDKLSKAVYIFDEFIVTCFFYSQKKHRTWLKFKVL